MANALPSHGTGSEPDRKTDRKALSAVPLRSRVLRASTRCREHCPASLSVFGGFRPYSRVLAGHEPIGAPGFEPGISASQTRRDNQASLRPEALRLYCQSLCKRSIHASSRARSSIRVICPHPMQTACPCLGTPQVRASSRRGARADHDRRARTTAHRRIPCRTPAVPSTTVIPHGRHPAAASDPLRDRSRRPALRSHRAPLRRDLAAGPRRAAGALALQRGRNRPARDGRRGAPAGG